MTTASSCIRQKPPEQSSEAVSSNAHLFFQINGSSLEQDKNSDLNIEIHMLKQIYYILGSTKLFKKSNFQIYTQQIIFNNSREPILALTVKEQVIL